MIDVTGGLDVHDVERLHMLVGDWQVIADLAFADLVLWLPTSDGDFVAVAHCRPTTGSTVHLEDIVGRRVAEGRRPLLARTMADGEIRRPGEPRWTGSFAVRDELVPVVRDGRPVAVLSREANIGTARTPSRLEINYVEAADAMCAMIARGEYPQSSAPTGSRRGAPRVGDGFLRLDADGVVLYASPNGMSCFHRLGVLGGLTGTSLAEAVTALIEDHAPVDETMAVVIMGRAAWRTEIESRGVNLSLRAIPITDRGERRGSIILVRDVSEVRRRERELVTKDATIREIHHRVKNNLQTVSALLRLQARRSGSEEIKAALGEATRRVATIALVHETLSQTIDEVVDFDEVFGRALRLAADVAAREGSVRTVVDGTFGEVAAQDATALAVVLTELVTNAVEHGLAARGGTVSVHAERSGTELTVRVHDDGGGLPEGTTMTGLGTQIVQTLVQGELDGAIDWHNDPDGGTEVLLRARLAEQR
ncbi:histidine kinase N-terminal domain-containing protein [Georgenia sp. 10Sc9-8]|uniref:histidine kinase n=1 Tax=Georgenia halotolerans TaxID=3028317 RepID=A0ABT5U157_9MICO|nr:histidine kinase N-terminal domain-containing protein [Georgenia halotolerans]